MVGKVATAVRKGIKSSSGHKRPQPGAPLRAVAPGEGRLLKRGVQAQWRVALRRRPSKGLHIQKAAEESLPPVPSRNIKGPLIHCFGFY